MYRGECSSTKENVLPRIISLVTPTIVVRSNSIVQWSILQVIPLQELGVALHWDSYWNWIQRDSQVEDLPAVYG